MYEEIKDKEKLISKLPKIKVISYLRDLLTYTSTLHEKIVLLEKEISDEKIKQINLKVNCPTSKLPEWEDKSGSKTTKNKKKPKKRKKNEGSGNQEKKNDEPTEINLTSNKFCPHCESDLTNVMPFEVFSRIVEDINHNPKSTNITLENQERVRCPSCKKKVTAQSVAALPKSDIGINTPLDALTEG